MCMIPLCSLHAVLLIPQTCWVTCDVSVCCKWDPHPVAGALTVSKRALHPSLTLWANCFALLYLLGHRTQVNRTILVFSPMWNGTNFPLRLLTLWPPPPPPPPPATFPHLRLSADFPRLLLLNFIHIHDDNSVFLTNRLKCWYFLVC